MMMDWQPIKTAPRDGRRVWVKRIFRRSIIKEGWAVWDTMAPDAPIRSKWGGHALADPIPGDNQYADTPRWLNEDRRHAFPMPTHWRPET